MNKYYHRYVDQINLLMWYICSNLNLFKFHAKMVAPLPRVPDACPAAPRRASPFSTASSTVYNVVALHAKSNVNPTQCMARQPNAETTRTHGPRPAPAAVATGRVNQKSRVAALAAVPWRKKGVAAPASAP